MQNKIKFSFYFPVISVFLILAGCKEKKQADQPSSQLTEIRFTQPHFNFGKISEGEIVAHTYYFKNTGTTDLLIKNVDSGCGCTSVNYSSRPLSPGKEGKIEITFNSSGRYGKQYKEILIFANLPKGKKTLSFTADVQ